MLVEVLFERAQPGLCYSDFVPHDGLFIGESMRKVISIDMPHSRAWNNFYRAATEPGLKHRWRHKRRLPYLDYLYLKRRSSLTIDFASENPNLHIPGNSTLLCASSYTVPHRYRDTEKILGKTDLWFDPVWLFICFYNFLCTKSAV